MNANKGSFEGINNRVDSEVVVVILTVVVLLMVLVCGAGY